MLYYLDTDALYNLKRIPDSILENSFYSTFSIVELIAGLNEKTFNKRKSAIRNALTSSANPTPAFPAATSARLAATSCAISYGIGISSPTKATGGGLTLGCLGGSFGLARGDLDGRQEDLPATVAQRADPILDHAKPVDEPFLNLPKSPMGRSTPCLHAASRLGWRSDRPLRVV